MSGNDLDGLSEQQVKEINEKVSQYRAKLIELAYRKANKRSINEYNKSITKVGRNAQMVAAFKAGKSIKNIAEDNAISPTAAKYVIDRELRKLEAKDRLGGEPLRASLQNALANEGLLPQDDAWISGDGWMHPSPTAVAALTEHQISTANRMGHAAVREIQEWLAQFGLALGNGTNARQCEP